MGDTWILTKDSRDWTFGASPSRYAQIDAQLNRFFAFLGGFKQFCLNFYKRK